MHAWLIFGLEAREGKPVPCGTTASLAYRKHYCQNATVKASNGNEMCGCHRMPVKWSEAGKSSRWKTLNPMRKEGVSKSEFSIVISE